MKEINLREYEAKTNYSIASNMPKFKLMSDYFNILKQDKKMQKKQGIEVQCFYRQTTNVDTISLESSWGETAVMFKFEGIHLTITFDKYKSCGNIYYDVHLSSDETHKIEGDFIYNKLFTHAVEVSNLKGSYFVMPRNEVSWEKKELEKRSFNDIFLPENLLSKIELYHKVYEMNGVLMRYLMAGNPGTGKTESALVLTNELNKQGVTIIKTPVCRNMKEKMELAEILAPSIVIYDDIDLALGSREAGFSAELLQDFLDILDGTEKIKDDVGILATTNSTSLLDLAAQRPGRFDRVLTFDNITLDNIKNIILKSLKLNFNIKASSPIAKAFTKGSIIEQFYISGATGAHIFNGIKMIKLRMDTMGKKNLSLKFISDEIEEELSIMKKINNSNSIMSNKINRDEESVIDMRYDESIDESCSSC